MQKSIETAKKISKDLGKNWKSELQEVNLYHIFLPVYSLTYNIETLNSIVCFIIYAYDNDSQWIELKADRIDNKCQIIKGLSCDPKEEVWQAIINNEIDEVLTVVGNYLEAITTWKWKTILSCFDYHAINIRKATEITKSTDELEAAKIDKAKGDLLKQCLSQRQIGEDLLKEIKADFVKTDRATQQDFEFEVTSAINIESWRSFIKHTLPKWKEKKYVN